MKRTLYFIHMTGCEACEEAKPFVEKFAADHGPSGAGDVDVVYFDLTAEEWPEDQVDPPESVPSYAVFVAGEPPRTLSERSLSREDLEKWAFAKKGDRPVTGKSTKPAPAPAPAEKPEEKT